MPGPILHMGATVMCSHGGQAMPTAPSPVVTGFRHADRHHRRALRGRRLRLCSARGNGPCVTAQWMVGAVRVCRRGSRWPS